MAVTIVADAGSASANSFATLAEANTFMEARLNASSWDSATDDSKNRALVEATRELSSREWTGYRSTGTQSLAWPRQWAVDPDNPVQGYFDTNTIPQRVKDATCELAFQFIKAGTTDVASLDAAHNIASESVDVLSTDYVEPHARAKGLARYPRVLNYVAPLLTSSGCMRQVVRG